ncbi:hypothetical protein QTP88_012688 [Uroleucon formosanum]
MSRSMSLRIRVQDIVQTRPSPPHERSRTTLIPHSIKRRTCRPFSIRFRSYAVVYCRRAFASHLFRVLTTVIIRYLDGTIGVPYVPRSLNKPRKIAWSWSGVASLTK